MRLFYESKLYDYESRAKAERHIQTMRKHGWSVKEQYEQSDGPYKWTVVFHRGAV